jgi:hypothetical protein
MSDIETSEPLINWLSLSFSVKTLFTGSVSVDRLTRRPLVDPDTVTSARWTWFRWTSNTR